MEFLSLLDRTIVRILCLNSISNDYNAEGVKSCLGRGLLSLSILGFIAVTVIITTKLPSINL